MDLGGFALSETEVHSRLEGSERKTKKGGNPNGRRFVLEVIRSKVSLSADLPRNKQESSVLMY